MSELHDAVARYGRRALVLHPRSKRPISTGWQHGESKATRALNLAQYPDANVGVLCGDGLVVLDVDPRHGGHDALASLPALPETFRVLTGGGGEHHYYRDRSRGLPSFTNPAAPGLEVKSRGTQVVAPPSIHPNTRRQYVADPSGPAWGTFADLPTVIAGLAPRPQSPQSPSPMPAGHDPADWFEQIEPRRYAALLASATPDRRGFILCPSPLGEPDRDPSLELFDTPERGWRCHRLGCYRNGHRAGGRIWDFYAHVLGFTGPLRGTDFLAIREMAETKIAHALGVMA